MFDRLLAPDRLWEAWFKVLRNRGGPGGDGESLDAFRIGVETRLARLAADVRGGTYRPGPYRGRRVIRTREGWLDVLRAAKHAIFQAARFAARAVACLHAQRGVAEA